MSDEDEIHAIRQREAEERVASERRKEAKRLEQQVRDVRRAAEVPRLAFEIYRLFHDESRALERAGKPYDIVIPIGRIVHTSFWRRVFLNEESERFVMEGEVPGWHLDAGLIAVDRSGDGYRLMIDKWWLGWQPCTYGVLLNLSYSELKALRKQVKLSRTLRETVGE